MRLGPRSRTSLLNRNNNNSLPLRLRLNSNRNSNSHHFRKNTQAVDILRTLFCNNLTQLHLLLNNSNLRFANHLQSL